MVRVMQWIINSYLNHCGLVTPYSEIVLSKHWAGKGTKSTSINGALSSNVVSDFHLRAFSQEKLVNSTHNISLEVTLTIITTSSYSAKVLGSYKYIGIYIYIYIYTYIYVLGSYEYIDIYIIMIIAVELGQHEAMNQTNNDQPFSRLFHAPTCTTSSGCFMLHRTVHALWNLYGNPYRNRAEKEEETVTWWGKS